MSGPFWKEGWGAACAGWKPRQDEVQEGAASTSIAWGDIQGSKRPHKATPSRGWGTEGPPGPS